MLSLSRCLVAFMCLAAAPLLVAQHTYHMSLDQAESAGTWGGTSILGALANPTPYEFEGILDLKVQSSAPPFGDFEIPFATARMLPTVVSAELPNPIPGLPPLAHVEMRNMAGEIKTLFPISTDPVTGDFLGPVLLTITNGTMFVKPIGSSGYSWPFAGYPIPEFDVEGSIRQVGAEVVITAAYDEQWDIGVLGYGFLGFNKGDITAKAPIVGAGIGLVVDPLTAGGGSTATIGNATPNAVAYLVYSVAGPGSTSVPQLNVVLDVLNPILAAGPTLTDAAGNLAWPLTVPPGTTGWGVWLQAMQFGKTSNVEFEVIA